MTYSVTVGMLNITVPIYVDVICNFCHSLWWRCLSSDRKSVIVVSESLMPWLHVK